MPPRGSFERRLLIVLVLFALLPTLVLLALGATLASEAVLLTGSPAAWERVAESGRELIGTAELSGDPALVQAAQRHRQELSASLVQARRWEFLISRGLAVLPFLTLGLAALLGWLALRAARAMARGMAAPIRQLVEWSGVIARGETLPEESEEKEPPTSEFAVLRDAFRSMSREITASREKAVEAERVRTWVAMARSVAHELKNPLTPLRLAVHTLEREPQPRSETEREALEVIATEAARLDELARSFAQFGRLPEGPPSEIDLRELLEYLLRSHLPSSVDHRLLTPVDLPRIEGHYDALNRAFANLILNALDAVDAARNGRPGGNIVIKVRVAYEGRGVEVRVLDNGKGIQPEDLERIWEPDFTTKSRGTGLGLALVRQTAQAHGGGAWARNRPEGGAEFRVVLPIRMESTPEAGIAPESGEVLLDPAGSSGAPAGRDST
jgi:signal transduction histidine kinase